MATSYSATPSPIASRPANIMAFATFPASRAILSSSSDLTIRMVLRIGVTFAIWLEGTSWSIYLLTIGGI